MFERIKRMFHRTSCQGESCVCGTMREDEAVQIEQSKLRVMIRAQSNAADKARGTISELLERMQSS